MIEAKEETKGNKGAMKIGILAGIISSVIIIVFIQPFIQFISPKLFYLISNSYSFLANYIYMNAAKGIQYTTESNTISLIGGGIFGIAMAIILIYWKERKVKLSIGYMCKTIVKGMGSFSPIVVAMIMLLFPVALFGSVFLENVNIELNLSFQQRVAVLGPYLTDNEEKILKSKWASMKNANDYNEVNKQLMEVAEKHHINIPKPF